MSIHTSRLLQRAYVAEQTLACVLERPAGFVFGAGQYVDITLPEPRFDDALGPMRSFSMASAPGERDLLIVMRMRDSAFKRSLAEMPLGAPLLVDGPADDLALTTGGPRPSVYLAGGVGVAPFLGAIRQAACGEGRLSATLFYSNRRPEDAAYLRELCTLAARVDGFRFIPTTTRTSDSIRSWTGESERLSAPMLARYLPSLVGPRYYLSGSTTFISGMCQAIERAGVPAMDIRIEMYAGY
ncbi:MAG TPA: FAD-dependent oxidoreductase [Gemmatimonadaceae bacterium]|nr:FAD-dependent oxidoreductase [Gemmatimonadaceae bacterium]